MNESRFHAKDNSEVQLRRNLLTVVLVLVAVALSFQGVRTGNIMLMLSVSLIPVAAYFLTHPSQLLVVSAWAVAAGIYVPGLSNMMTLPDMISLIIIVMSLGSLALGRQRIKTDSAAPYLFLLIVLIILLMAIRGSGFRVFGGSTWGGKGYIRILIPILVFLLAGWLRLSDLLVKKILIGTLLFGVIPIVLQGLINTTGAFGWLAQYFNVERATGIDLGAAVGPGDTVTRIGGWSSLAFYILPFSFVFIPKRINRNTWIFGIAAICVVLCALSGFRASTFNIMAVTFLYGMFCMKEVRKKWILLSLIGGICGYLFLFVASASLPMTIQRAVSWVPGIEISSLASKTAIGSTDFRLEIWRLALPDMGRYLLLGKGIAVDVQSMAWMQGYYYGTPEFFYKIHNYHSGPISLLMDFGLPGFFLVTGFFIRVCVENFRSWRQIKPEGIMALYHRFLTVSLFWQMIVFFVLYGDMVDMFPSMVFRAALLLILRRSCIEAQQAKEQKTISVVEAHAAGPLARLAKRPALT